jgi:hypothetical protein
MSRIRFRPMAIPDEAKQEIMDSVRMFEDAPEKPAF